MVYLGPINRRPESLKTPLRPSRVTAVRAYASEAQGAGVDAAPIESGGGPDGVERRKQDRRSKSGDHLVETRAGRDRRKSSRLSVNILI
jgi:hypothetical protein